MSSNLGAVQRKAPNRQGWSVLLANLLALGIGGCIGCIGLLLSPWLAVAFGVGFGLLLLLLARPMVICYMLLGVIVLTSGMERGAILPLLKPNEIVFLIALMVALIISLVNPKLRHEGGGYLLFSGVVLGLGTALIPLAAYLTRQIDLSTQDILALTAPIQYFLLFWVFAAIPQTHQERYRLILLMIGLGGLIALIGLLQGAGVGFVQSILDTYYPSSHGAVADEAGRVTSLFGAWNATGIFLMANSLLCWGVLPSVNVGWERAYITVALAASILGLIATGSFAGIGTLFAGILLVTAIQGRAGRVFPILVVLAILLVALIFVLQPIVGPLIEQRLDYQFSGKRGQDGWIPQTLTFRFDVWQEFFWPSIRANPIWGTRPTIPAGFGWHAFESQYIGLLFSTGIIGLISWIVWLLGSFSWLLWLQTKMAGFGRSVGSVALVFLAMMAVAGFTNAVFTFAGSVDYLWIMLAITAGTASEFAQPQTVQ